MNVYFTWKGHKLLGGQRAGYGRQNFRRAPSFLPPGEHALDSLLPSPGVGARPGNVTGYRCPEEIHVESDDF